MCARAKTPRARLLLIVRPRAFPLDAVSRPSPPGFYQQHTNGHEIIGFYHSRADMQGKRVRHGHSRGFVAEPGLGSGGGGGLPTCELTSRTKIKVLSENGNCRLDVGGASMRAEIDASHESWATRLFIRRLDGPSEGPVELGHLVGIFASNNNVRLDVGCASVREVR